MEGMNVNTNELVEVVEEVTENGSGNNLVKLGIAGVVIAGVAALAYVGYKKIKARKQEIDVIDLEPENYDVVQDENTTE